jgi:hypothetical protein
MHMESTLGGATFPPHSHLTPGHPGLDASRGSGINQAEPSQLHAHLSSILAENQDLRAQLEQLRADRAKMAEIVTRLTELLGSESPDRLVHDLRNVLNERELYRALADSAM